EAGVLQGVLIVTEDDVEFSLIEHETKEFHRVTGHPDEADLPFFLHTAQFGKGFIDDLLHRNKLNVVAETNIQVIHSHPVQAHVHALNHPSRREVEVSGIVAAEFAAEQIAVPRNAA